MQKRASSALWGLAGVALMLSAVRAETQDSSASRSTKIQQSGGSHRGDNVVGDQSKYIFNGDVTIVVPVTPGESAPAPSSKNKTVPPPQRPRLPRSSSPKLPAAAAALGKCVLPRPKRSVVVIDGQEVVAHSSTESAALFEQNLITSPFPISHGELALEVEGGRFEHELACLELPEFSCSEYSLVSRDGKRRAQRRWTQEWEDQERQGLLKDPARLERIVRCFPDDTDIEGQETQPVWLPRMKKLEDLLSQEQVVVDLGLARQRALEIEVLKRWAHLLLVSGMSQEDGTATLQAAEIFGRAADLAPKEEWLRAAAISNYQSADALTEAADEQAKSLRSLTAVSSLARMSWPLERKVLDATVRLVELRIEAGQYDSAAQILRKLRTDLAADSWIKQSDRTVYQVLAHVLTATVLRAQGQYVLASEFYEAAADLAAKPDATRTAQERDIEVAISLLQAGSMACTGGDYSRMTALDARIRRVSSVAAGNAKDLGWIEWRYLMARWYALGRLRKRNEIDGARSQADAALEKLLRRPVEMDMSSPFDARRAGKHSVAVFAAPFPADLLLNSAKAEAQPQRPIILSVIPPIGSSAGMSTSVEKYVPKAPSASGYMSAQQFTAVPTLEAIAHVLPFVGTTPPQYLALTRAQIDAASVPTLYRSVLEGVYQAGLDIQAHRLDEAVATYELTTRIALKLSEHLPVAGTLLEVVILRSYVSFLQGIARHPASSERIAKRADELEMQVNCAPGVVNAYRTAPHKLVENYSMGKTITTFGAVSLSCPFLFSAQAVQY
jgi:tetratricopeptide (TPR) repeat protein